MTSCRRSSAVARGERGTRAALLLGCLMLVQVVPGLAPGARADASSAARYGLPDFTELVERTTGGRQHQHPQGVAAQPGGGRTAASSPGLEGSPIDELIRRYREGERPADPSASSALGSGFIVSGGRLRPDQQPRRGRRRRGRGPAPRPAPVRRGRRRHRSELGHGGAQDRRHGPAVVSDRRQRGASKSANGCSRSARRSVSTSRSPPASSAPRAARCPTRATCRSSRPTWRSTRATPGGPLFNLDGDVVGINSQIYRRTGSFMGLSFAIPIEMAMDVADQIRATTARRAAAGWGHHPGGHGGSRRVLRHATPPTARWSRTSCPDSPAADSPLESATSSPASTVTGRALLGAATAGGRVPIANATPVEVVRDGRTVELTVSSAPAGDGTAGDARPPAPTRPAARARTRRRTRRRRTRERLASTGRGGVREVVEGGPAERAGMIAGDVVLMVDNESIDSSRDLDRRARRSRRAGLGRGAGPARVRADVPRAQARRAVRPDRADAAEAPRPTTLAPRGLSPLRGHGSLLTNCSHRQLHLERVDIDGHPRCAAHHVRRAGAELDGTRALPPLSGPRAVTGARELQSGNAG